MSDEGRKAALIELAKGRIAGQEVVPPEKLSFLLTVEQSKGPGEDVGLLSIDGEMSPDAGAAKQQGHVVFVIDRSGSMRGDKIIAAQKIFDVIFSALSDDTLVSVMFYGDADDRHYVEVEGARRFTKQQAEVGNIHSKVRAVAANGRATDIAGALRDSATLITADASRAPSLEEVTKASVVFLTDGLDNVFQRVHAGNLDSVENLLMVMHEKYTQNILPRIIPIGVGHDYSLQLLTSMGQVNKTGFWHIPSSYNVAAETSTLQGLIDSVRVSTKVYIEFNSGSSELLDWTFLQRTVSRNFTCLNTGIKSVYLIAEEGADVHVVSLLPTVPAATEYDDKLLRQFLLAEVARLNMVTRFAQDGLEVHLERVKYLLRHYPREYWQQKDGDCDAAIGNLERLYCDLENKISHRGDYVQELEFGHGGLMFRGRRDDADLHALTSADSQCVAACFSPGDAPGF